MLIPQVPVRTTRQNASLSIQRGRERKKIQEGAAVVVLVAGRYNGPDNKSLGFCPEGTAIRVATGSYLEHILQHRLVQLDDGYAPVLPDEEGEATPVEAAAPPPDDLNETGLGRKDVKALQEAGFDSKAAVMKSFGVFGLNEIVAVAGMTEAKARRVVAWAGIRLPEE